MNDMNKKKISRMALLGLTVLVIGGCGRKADDTEKNGSGGEALEEAVSGGEVPEEALSGGTEPGDSAFERETSDSGGDVVKEPETIYEEPPAIVLCPVTEEGDSLLVKPCGYSWNWPLDAGQMAAALADGPVPTSEGTHWDTLMLPEDSVGMAEYGLTMEVIPDELGIDVWEMTDVGNNEAAADRTAVYQKAEIDVENFAISLQAGKIYEIYMVWDEENIGENGCFGAACYVFMTACPEQEENDAAMTVTDAAGRS